MTGGSNSDKRILPETWEKMHHAYLVLGTDIMSLENELAVSLDFKRQGNPDTLFGEHESFGIDEARNLSVWAIKKPFGARKVAFIKLASMTSEAQNALLKLFEEPVANTYFFLILVSLGGVIPTLLSRVHVLVGSNSADGGRKLGEDFLKADVSKRFKIIDPIIKNKDKEKARKLIASISSAILAKENRDAWSLGTVLNSEKFIRGRAPSLKLILEWLVLTLK